jgi:hypothetical protein
MGKPLTELLPYTAQNLLRLQVLEHLLLVGPSEWRLRRTDKFSPLDLDTYQQTVSIDFRLRRPIVVKALELARSNAGDSEVRRNISRVIGRERDYEAQGSPEWTDFDGLVPIAWIYGPLTDLVVTVDGHSVIPLTRYQTAEVVSNCMNRAYSLFRDVDSGLPPDIRELCWYLLATDSLALAGSGSLRLMSCNSDRVGDDVLVRSWFRKVLEGVGFDDTSYLNEQFFVSETKTLLARSMNLLRAEFGEHDVKREQCVNPLWNPMFAFRAFLLKRLSWDVRNSSAAVRPEPEKLLTEFLSLCHVHLNLVEWMRANDSSADEDRRDLALYLADILPKCAVSWPLVVRTRIAADAAHRATYSVSCRYRHKKGLREQLYPVTSGDALSYHIEVSSCHPELRLRPNAGLVQLPRRNFRWAWLRKFVRGSSFEPWFPMYRMSARDYFHRSDESSSLIHAYYEAPLTEEHFRLPGGACGGDEDEDVQLVIPYGLLDTVRWANRIVSLILLTLSAYVLFLSLRGAYLPPGAHYSVDLFEVAKSVSAVYLAVVLLFTLERHNSPLVAALLRRQWRLVLTALTIATIAVLAWAARTHPDSVPIFGGVLTSGWAALATGGAAAWAWATSCAQGMAAVVEAAASAVVTRFP